MNISLKGLTLIKEFEGLKLRSYRLNGEKWTIGYGHTTSVKKGDAITPKQAEIFLHEDITLIVKRLNQLITVTVTQNQFDVLCSFVFNIGVGAFSTSTLLKKLNAGDYHGAAEEFTKWCYVTRVGTKIISSGLLNRRQQEKALFEGNIPGA